MSPVTAAIAVPRLVMIPWAVVRAADPRLAAMVTGIVIPNASAVLRQLTQRHW